MSSNLPSTFYTVTDGDTTHTNPRSMRYPDFESAQTEARARLLMGRTTHVFILRAVAVMATGVAAEAMAPKTKPTPKHWSERLPAEYRDLAAANWRKQAVNQLPFLETASVGTAFVWGDSPEGSCFWRGVDQYLYGHCASLPPLPPKIVTFSL